jgi:hypothetical protein
MRLSLIDVVFDRLWMSDHLESSGATNGKATLTGRPAPRRSNSSSPQPPPLRIEMYDKRAVISIRKLTPTSLDGEARSAAVTSTSSSSSSPRTSVPLIEHNPDEASRALASGNGKENAVSLLQRRLSEHLQQMK